MSQDQQPDDKGRVRPTDEEDRFSLAAASDFLPADKVDSKRNWPRIITISAIAMALVVGAATILTGLHDGRRVPAAGTVVTEEEFAQEWAWVQRRMGLSGLPVPPVVMAGNLLPVLGRSKTDGTHIIAGLSFGGVVVLDERDADFDDLEFRSRVVHEFIHQAQYAMGLSGCGLERDAYRLQNEWLAERGLPAYATAEAVERVVQECEERKR